MPDGPEMSATSYELMVVSIDLPGYEYPYGSAAADTDVTRTPREGKTRASHPRSNGPTK